MKNQSQQANGNVDNGENASIENESDNFTKYYGKHSSTTLHKRRQSQNYTRKLSMMEKKFLLAVERGDLPAVKRIINYSNSSTNITDDDRFDIDCCDPIGRNGLLMAIDNENIEMIKLLLVSGIQMKDALLHAINEDFVEAVELLLDHESQIHVAGQPHSWESVERETFTNDITPLILAAHRNNYEIVKIILDRNISPIPIPHCTRCGCKQCRVASKEDCLQHSRSRINAFKALSSPSLIALSSKDPILTAFDLSWQLKRLSFLEPEFKNEYQQLRKQCQSFATALLDHTRTSDELETLLDYDTERDPIDTDHERLQLSRLKLAIQIKQKTFCAHASVQQLLASIWYDGLPGFRRKNIVRQIFQLIGIGLLFPFLSIAYIVAPYSMAGKFIKKPFIKFICHSASYITFLILLMLASQRIETNIFGLNPMENVNNKTTKRGSLPSYIELCILAWVFGLIWSEIKQLWDLGIIEYLSDMWNILDFINNSLYVATITLRIIAYYQTKKELMNGLILNRRENWDDFDPILLSEGLFATANIFSSLKLVYIFSVNPYLGPLQISLGRMVIDILKFFSIYLLVLFSFACGMNQLLWYYADLEKQSCFVQQFKSSTNDSMTSQTTSAMINEISHPNACLTWRRFANLFESTQTLFWATFGLIDLDDFELTGIKSYTRFWGLLMFGVYSIINVAVLLNLLIAMMNHSYQSISEQADIEWKFARSKLWMSYFSDGATVPPPFNIIPTPKSLFYMIVWMIRFCLGKTKRGKNEAIRISRRKQIRANERDHKYYHVIRSLVRRYIMNEQRIQERQRGVTEDDCNEIKQEVSALRYELIDILGHTSNLNNNNNLHNHTCSNNLNFLKKFRDSFNDSPNFNFNFNDNDNDSCQSICPISKKSRQRERRLIKGFNFDQPLLFDCNNINNDSKERLIAETNFELNNTISDDNNIEIDGDHKKISKRSSVSISPLNSNYLLKNKFYRTAQQLVQNKKITAKWKQFRNNHNHHQQHQQHRNSHDSFESDCTVNTDNSCHSHNHLDNQNRPKYDADLKRQIFARKFDSMTLSQPAISFSSLQRKQQKRQPGATGIE